MRSFLAGLFIVLSSLAPVKAWATEVSGSLIVYWDLEEPFAKVLNKDQTDSYHVVLTAVDFEYYTCTDGVYELEALPPNYDTYQLESFYCRD